MKLSRVHLYKINAHVNIFIHCYTYLIFDMLYLGRGSIGNSLSTQGRGKAVYTLSSLEPTCGDTLGMLLLTYLSRRF